MKNLDKALSRIAAMLNVKLMKEIAERGFNVNSQLLQSIQTEIQETREGVDLVGSLEAPEVKGNKLSVFGLMEVLKQQGIIAGNRELKDAAEAIQLALFVGIDVDERGKEGDYVEQTLAGTENDIFNMLEEAVNQDLEENLDHIIGQF